MILHREHTALPHSWVDLGDGLPADSTWRQQGGIYWQVASSQLLQTKQVDNYIVRASGPEAVHHIFSYYQKALEEELRINSHVFVELYACFIIQCDGLLFPSECIAQDAFSDHRFKDLRSYFICLCRHSLHCLLLHWSKCYGDTDRQ